MVSFFEDVKDKRYVIHPIESIVLKEREPPESLRNQYQVKNETQMRKNQKIVRNGNNELEVKLCSGTKNQKKIQTAKTDSESQSYSLQSPFEFGRA